MLEDYFVVSHRWCYDKFRSLYEWEKHDCTIMAYKCVKCNSKYQTLDKLNSHKVKGCSRICPICRDIIPVQRSLILHVAGCGRGSLDLPSTSNKKRNITSSDVSKPKRQKVVKTSKNG